VRVEKYAQSVRSHILRVHVHPAIIMTDFYGLWRRSRRLSQAHAASPEAFKLRSNLGKVSGALQQPDFPIFQLGAFAILFFCPQHFSPCRNSPSLMPPAWPRWLLLGRLFLFFNPGFFSPRHLLTHHSIVECFPRGTGCCALICNCETWFAILPCCTCIRLTRYIVLTVTRHGSCIGGVLHPGISDSWFFRR
jgi:hypothetical protein